MTGENTDYATESLLAAIEAMDIKLTSNEGGFHAAEDQDGFISRYTMPVGPWHKILGLARNGAVNAELTRLRQIEQDAIKMLIAHIAIKGSCPESLRWKSPNCYKYPAIAAAARAQSEQEGQG